MISLLFAKLGPLGRLNNRHLEKKQVAVSTQTYAIPGYFSEEIRIC